MSGFKKRLSFMFSSSLERDILSLFHGEVTGFINEETCEELAAILENRSSKHSRQEAVDCLSKQTKKATNWPFALRTLMVFHKLTHMQGDILTDFLTNNQMDTLAQFQVPKTPLKTFIHSAMVSHYYKYLQKLSYNYEDLSVCFFTAADFPQRLKENDLSVLHFISKVQNILKYLLELLPLLEVSLTQLEPTDLIKQITYFCLTDCYYYYTYTSQIIGAMIDEIFKLNEQDALFLFELYCENLKITRQLRGFFQLKTFLRQFSLKIPSFFGVDAELNRRVELHIASIKKGETKPVEKKQSRTTLGSNLEIDVEAEEDPNILSNLGPSLPDLSNALVQIITPSFKSVQKKELFKPPVLNKHNPALSPRINLTSPTEQSQNAFRGFDELKRGSTKAVAAFNPFMAKENIFKAIHKDTLHVPNGQTHCKNPSKGEYKPLTSATPDFSPNNSFTEGRSPLKLTS